MLNPDKHTTTETKPKTNSQL